MTRPTRILWLAVFGTALLLLPGRVAAQNSSQSIVPRLIKFSGTLQDQLRDPLKGPMGVTFALYTQQSGSAALWMETQNVETDEKGNYTVLLGANSANGVPAELFSSGEARWLGVQVERQLEQPRVLLVSVPYALKAGDAQTLGGLPPSAFIQTQRSGSGVLLPTGGTAPATQAFAPLAGTAVTTPGLTSGSVPVADGTSDIKNSQIADDGTTVAIGGCTPDPTSKLDVCGGLNVGGPLQLPSTGKAVAGATGGMNSQPFDLFSSTFNSALNAAIPQHFRWQLEPVGQNTATPGAKLSLQYAAAPAALAETGFSIDNKGLITFAKGQTLPAVTGNETVSGNFTASGSVSGASAKFTGGVSTGSQTVTGNISASGSLTAGSANLGATTVKGNSLNLALGDPGCSTGFAGLGPSPLSGCTNYALTVDVNKNLYLNRPTGGQMFFREGNTKTEMTIAPGGNIHAFGNLRVEGPAQGGSGSILASWGGNGDFAIDAPGVSGGRFVVKDTSGNVGMGTAMPSALLHLNRFVPSGGTDLLNITSGGNPDVASLLLQNTGGGLRLRLGAGTGLAYLASSGSLAFVAHDSGTPSFPGIPQMTISAAGNVGIGITSPSFALHVNGMVRSETGLSLGGNAPVAVDAPGTIGGRFAVLANGNVGINNPNPSATLDVRGSVGIGGDTPISSNPHMSFSGFFFGSLCGFGNNCGGGGGSGLGAFVPERNILITRMMLTMNDLIDPSCEPAHARVDIFNGPGFLDTPILTVTLPSNTFLVDSGPTSVSVSAGTTLRFVAQLDNPGNCNVGASAGGNVFANIQYVMQ